MSLLPERGGVWTDLRFTDNAVAVIESRREKFGVTFFLLMVGSWVLLSYALGPDVLHRGSTLFLWIACAAAISWRYSRPETLYVIYDAHADRPDDSMCSCDIKHLCIRINSGRDRHDDQPRCQLYAIFGDGSRVFLTQSTIAASATVEAAAEKLSLRWGVKLRDLREDAK